ncbi:MAG: amidohydrolase family protein [Myxococcales bacterium]
MKRFRLPWIRDRKRTAPEIQAKVPLQIGALSNGEIFRGETRQSRMAQRIIFELAERGAKRLDLDRREFLASSMGMASSLYALNMMSACASDDGQPRPDGGFPGDGGGGGSGEPGGPGSGGRDGGRQDAGMRSDGGYFEVPDDPTDPEVVCEVMLDASKEFIFDIQTHHVNRANSLYNTFLTGLDEYTQYCGPRLTSAVDCFDRSEYIRLMFLESDTTVAVLSGLPAVDDPNNPITNAEIAESRDIINMLADGTNRLINHHMVLPNQMGPTKDKVDLQLAAMERTLHTYGKVGAWKCYPAWAPENNELVANGGYFLDDEATGARFIAKGLELGVNTFCVHKGLPIPGFSAKYNDPEDIGRVAKMFPKAKFIIYHSGFGNQRYEEGPYTEGSRVGTNSLITSLLANGIKPNGNVFAELGTTWQVISTNVGLGFMNAAAHVIGKLLKYVGQDNVVWGTDSIWYGSPQSQIESFLQFQISKSFQDQYGYPALTMELKRKILGLNAAKAYGIDVSAMRCGVNASELAEAKRLLDAERGGRRWAFVEPKLTSRREFFAMKRAQNFRPG